MSRRWPLAVLGWLAFLPAIAFAQASMAGTPHDPSGGVLPGVTVEAASPLLVDLRSMRRALSSVIGSHKTKIDLRDTQNQPDTTEGYKFLVRGFIAMQIDRDQHDMGASQPLFPPPTPLPSTLRFTANQSKLGFGLEAPPLKQWTNRVYVELDFLSPAPAGADRLTTRAPRMRQAFWLLGWSEDRSTLLVGQAPVVFGDLV